LEARGQVVLITDADLSAPIEELPKLVDPILGGDRDLTLGSRALDRSLIGVHQSVFREYAGRLFNGMVQLLTGLPFRDTQCGFKAFRREPMLPVLARQRIAGFGFDPEILFLARTRGLRLEEIPVRWSHAEGTKVRLLRDGLKMILGLLLIRWNQVMGKYR
ncbi:MAG: glycosyltransferase family 2 protein, partial [Acidobacteriota bacterium]|nr:glycosyltransferase family 2 protein [Acidobacteriota bacterium]